MEVLNPLPGAAATATSRLRRSSRSEGRFCALWLPRNRSFSCGFSEVARFRPPLLPVVAARAGVTHLLSDQPDVRKRLGVFVSGGGSNFRSIHKATVDGTVDGAVVIVVSDKPECKACDYAREHNIPVTSYPKGKFAPDGVSSKELVDTLRQHNVDYVLLAGYLKLIPNDLVEAFPRAILNIHPALLPAFGGKGYYGLKVHQAVIASGARVSGPTIHFVDENYDSGRILAQKTVPVFANDTPEKLAARVLQQEHALYVEAVAALCQGRIEWRADGVPLIRKSLQSDEFY